MAFQRVSTFKQWMIGSIESDTGSEYLFGFDPAAGLLWLERAGVEYGPQDAAWREADSYIRASSLSGSDLASTAVENEDYVEEQYTVPVSVGADRPRTVTRSVMGSAPEGGFDTPTPGDPRIVGDLSDEGRELSEEDIADQAAAFLQNLGEGEE